jgi:hypothetical protein
VDVVAGLALEVAQSSWAVTVTTLVTGELLYLLVDVVAGLLGDVVADLVTEEVPLLAEVQGAVNAASAEVAA